MDIDFAFQTADIGSHLARQIGTVNVGPLHLAV